jgi:serine phosphatase RsbU (regulator of sigma subunit)
MIDPAGVPRVPEPASEGWTVHGVRLSTRIMAAEGAPRGGDWCEAFIVSDEELALSVGDVCGHGEDKYAAMIATRRAIREAACRGLDPAQTLVAAHRSLQAHDPDEYATAIFGLFNLRSRTLAFANAGHPPPLAATPRRAFFLEYGESDLPLGIENSCSPAIHEADVPRSTLLVFYTDGVTERKRRPVEGAGELRGAAIFATKFPSLPAAWVIEKQLSLSGANRDDAAILTAWTPPTPGAIWTPTKVFRRPS